METLWQYLDRTSIIIGIVMAIPVAWTWWQVVYGERRQRRRWLKELSASPGNRPGVLIIDLLPGKNISASVHRYLHTQSPLASLPKDRIQTVTRNTQLHPEATADYAREIRHAYRALLDAGVDVIHLFHAGPDVTALILGAELANGPRINVHHYDQGSYIAFGPLEPLRK